MNIRDKKVLSIILADINDIEQAFKTFNCSSMDDFLKDRLLQKCTVMSLINISEAIGELSTDFLAENKKVNWKQFKKLRNIAAHKYGAINFIVVWNILQTNLPGFKEGIINSFGVD